MQKPKPLKFRPYARLLTMLGDQLIKNERVALVEVIKNSYDADASWVKVNFVDFDADFGVSASSRIIIEDDGVGMSSQIIEQHWVNPATPGKLIAKKEKPTTRAGRVIQGEKGIGRFALLKLGRRIVINTRPEVGDAEYRLTLDLSQYDEDFIPTGEKPLFLDELNLELAQASPPLITEHSVSLGARTVKRPRHGTRIEVSHLKNAWSYEKVEKVFEDLARLQSVFDIGTTRRGTALRQNLTFEVVIYRGKEYQPFSTRVRERLENLLENHAVLRVEDGQFDEARQEFQFKLDGVKRALPLTAPELTGLTVFRKYFGNTGEVLRGRGVQCGPFGFSFYAFDFSADAQGKYLLDADDKKLIKDHRIYLYRDGIRVYPYGDPEDDWLQIDVYRGTIRASEFLSNDQVVGYVTITQEKNPQLRDKTSREGLIDSGYATDDFKALLQVFLAWMRKGPYEEYRRKLKVAHDVDIFKQAKVEDALTAAWKAAQDTAPPEVQQKLIEAANLYKAERKYLVHRAETTEHLAGVGLSVETASHDLMVAMQRTLGVVDALISETHKPGVLDKAVVNRDLTMIRGSLSFIETQLKDIQLLFKSTKQRRRDVRVGEVLAKVVRLFQPALTRAKIKLQVEETSTPLVAKTTDAVLLQLLLNLFDNAVYWLEGKVGARHVLIRLDGEEGTLVFADDGPGIRSEDRQHIFDPFFSGKGEEGRGLGLYIARQLLERHGYRIELADTKSHKPLPGACFVVWFVQDGGD